MTINRFITIFFFFLFFLCRGFFFVLFAVSLPSRPFVFVPAKLMARTPAVLRITKALSGVPGRPAARDPRGLREGDGGPPRRHRAGGASLCILHSFTHLTSSFSLRPYYASTKRGYDKMLKSRWLCRSLLCLNCVSLSSGTHLHT